MRHTNDGTKVRISKGGQLIKKYDFMAFLSETYLDMDFFRLFHPACHIGNNSEIVYFNTNLRNNSEILYFNTNFHELIINYWNGRKSFYPLYFERP